jgi:hypothetical protein
VTRQICSATLVWPRRALKCSPLHCASEHSPRDVPVVVAGAGAGGDHKVVWRAVRRGELLLAQRGEERGGDLQDAATASDLQGDAVGDRHLVDPHAAAREPPRGDLRLERGAALAQVLGRNSEVGRTL